MAKQTIAVGTTANDGTGDDLRAGGVKINANFTELYSGDVFGRITLNHTGSAGAANSAFELEVKGDPAASADYSALFISSRDGNAHRIYLGDQASNIYALNLSNVTQIESMPPFQSGNMYIGADTPFSIRGRGDGVQDMEFNSASPAGATGGYVWKTDTLYTNISSSVETMRLDRNKRLTVQGPVKSKVVVSSSNPSTTDIPDGFEEIWHNTTTGDTSRWVNIGGTLKSLVYLP